MLARIAVAGLVFAGGALTFAGQAGADPDPLLPTPVPGDPAAPPPGQPAVVAAPDPAAPAPALPAGPPMVPEMQNPGYGQGQSGESFGYLRDLWHAARSGDPLSALTVAGGGGAPGPPPGAGPAPKLPPGYTSLTAPDSSTPGTGYPSLDAPGAPALPPGYYSTDGPPPPGWYDQPPSDPAAPPTTAVATPPQ